MQFGAPFLAFVPCVLLSAVRRVLVACQDPDVRIYKISFMVWSSTR